MQSSLREIKQRKKRIKKNHKIKINFSENVPPQNEELKARETGLKMKNKFVQKKENQIKHPA